jgi:hypothetical protein
MMIIIYEERWESMWNTNRTKQYTQSKLEDIMIEGILQEVSQERPNEKMRDPDHEQHVLLCGHHTILNMRKSRRKNPFFFFFFVEGGALWVCRDDGRYGGDLERGPSQTTCHRKGWMKAELTASRQPTRDNFFLMLPLRDQSRGDVPDAHYWVQQPFVSTWQGYCRFLREEIRRR